MGEVRRKSSDQLRIRLELPSEDRETLLTCDACGGDGSILTEKADGTYRKGPCKWCLGEGMTDKNLRKLFNRWQRIYRVNRKAGRCG